MNLFLVKTFGLIKSTGRLAFSLFLASLGLIIIVFVYLKADEFIENKRAEKYEASLDWNADLKRIGFDAKAKTKLTDGRLYLQLKLNGYPEYLTHPSLVAKNLGADFIIDFVDSDGFTVYSKRIKLSEFMTMVDSENTPQGLSTQYSEYLSVESYKRFEKLQIGWSLETNIPKDKTPIKNNGELDLSSSDHCAPSLSRSERLKRLARHGVVRETGQGSFSAGTKTILFQYDGTVLYCN
jgi:hypothetical protein